jgi:hypothetical protein
MGETCEHVQNTRHGHKGLSWEIEKEDCSWQDIIKMDLKEDLTCASDSNGLQQNP